MRIYFRSSIVYKLDIKAKLIYINFKLIKRNKFLVHNVYYFTHSWNINVAANGWIINKTYYRNIKYDFTDSIVYVCTRIIYVC